MKTTRFLSTALILLLVSITLPALTGALSTAAAVALIGCELVLLVAVALVPSVRR